MKKLALLFTFIALLVPLHLAAQSIDFGRGELPITVPETYSAEFPTPLIILLHGYSSSGRGQDMYLGFSRIAAR